MNLSNHFPSLGAVFAICLVGCAVSSEPDGDLPGESTDPVYTRTAIVRNADGTESMLIDTVTKSEQLRERAARDAWLVLPCAPPEVFRPALAPPP